MIKKILLLASMALALAGIVSADGYPPLCDPKCTVK